MSAATDDLAQADAPGDLVCSARRCGAGAANALLWNNPALHTPQRRKTWLACPEHTDHLAQYLQVRGFLRSVVPVTDLLGRPDGTGPAQ